MKAEQQTATNIPPIIHVWERILVILIGVGFTTAILLLLWGHYGELKTIKITAGLLGLLAFIFCTGLWKIGIRGLFSRRSMLFLIWYFVGALSLVILLYAFEGWRGKREWNLLAREVELRGESINCSSIFPKPVPNDQNLMFAPDAAKYFFDGETYSKEAHYDFHAEFLSNSNWVYGAFTDFKRWHTPLNRIGKQLFPATQSTQPTANSTGEPLDNLSKIQQAEAIKRDLGCFDSLFASLKTASNRSYARFPLNAHDGWFAQTNITPKLALRTLVQALSLRASAQLALQQANEAFSDILLSFRLIDVLDGEPFFHSWKIKSQLYCFTLQPIWEGISLHLWTDSQLKTFCAYFNTQNVDNEWKTILRNEVLLYIDLVDRLQSLDNSVNDLKWIMFFYPKGWLYLDRVWLYRFYQRQTQISFMPSDFTRESNALRVRYELRTIDDPFIATFILPKMLETIEDVQLTATRNQILMRLAVAACALEQYRIKIGTLPKSLEELVPGFLPRIPFDVIPNQPLMYRLNPDGSFLIYSVGWNQRDEGGKRSPFRQRHHFYGLGASNTDIKEGDWPWPGIYSPVNGNYLHKND